VSGDTTQYVLDLAATLPVVISDTEAVYLYGLDIIAQQQAGRQYYFHDGLGSVRQLVDGAGEVQTNYAYDPFGVPVVAGDVSNPYQFTGEAWDEEVELLYLRARYYQPETGRFTAKDPWAGDVWRPGTLNRYAYVTNNPVNLLDPTGMDAPDPWARACMLEGTCPEVRYLASKLKVLYGILVGGPQGRDPAGGPQWHDAPSGGACPEGEYALWSDWTWSQLDLVERAAADFAGKMEGGMAGFRSKVAPVHLYKREGALVIPFMGGVGGFTGPTGSITLPGIGWDSDGGASMKGTIVHELAHVWDMHTGWGRLSTEMASGFWPHELAECQVPPYALQAYLPVVKDWQVGRERQWLNPAEDWADSVFAYVYHEYAHQKHAEISKSRWYFVGAHMNPGNPHRFLYPADWTYIPFRDTPLRKIDPPKVSAEDRREWGTDR
jgi:RHS repeat-associated protein